MNFKLPINQKGIIPPILLILLAALGIIIFILISSSASFRDRLFSTLYPKPTPRAQEVSLSVPDEILLKFKPGVPDKIKDNTLKAYGLKKIDTIPNIEVIQAKVPEKAKTKVIEALKKNSRIEYAEPNFLGKELVIPNDTAFTSGAQWNLKIIGSPAAWDITKGNSSTVVAVIDSGVYTQHEDLLGKILPGYNFVDNNTNTGDATGHGTIVSGVVGAVTNNGKGVASLGWDTPIMPLRVVDSAGYAGYANIAKAVNYAADNGAKSINISLGGTYNSTTLQDAINYAWSKGLVIAAAAGNNGTCCVLYPAAADNVIAVGGTTSSDTKASFSQIGDKLDVVAPGQGIYSTNRTGSYGGYSGTSYASPHVAALAALIMSANPLLTNQQVVDIITSTAKDLGTAGWDQAYGWGRIQADQALSKATGTDLPPKDTQVPTISITSPTSGSTVSGGVAIKASASDNVGVVLVSFLGPGGFYATDLTSPYEAYWDSTTVANGTYTLYARATDAAGNVGGSDITVTVNNPVPDTTKPTTAITNPTDGSTVSDGVTIQADASDNVAVSSVSFFIDGVFVGEDTFSPYTYSWDTTKETNGSHTIQSKALDTSNNLGESAIITVNVNNPNPPSPTPSPTPTTPTSTPSPTPSPTTTPTPTPVPTPTPTPVPTPTPTPTPIPTPPPDTQPPTAPTNLLASVISSSQINLSWTASTDNVVVTGYDVYRNSTKIATVTTTSYGDANLASSTTYSYYVKAFDASGNVSSPSNTVTVTTQPNPTPAPIQTGNIQGVVSSSLSGVLSAVKVSLFVSGSKQTYQTNSLGVYNIANLNPATYSLKFQEQGYVNQTVSVTVQSSKTTTQDVILVKR